MFQPQVKLAFIERYCNPRDGWFVFADIDPSEEGRTGGARRTGDAQAQQLAMRSAADNVRVRFAKLGVTVGGSRDRWFHENGLPEVGGDRDIVAFQPSRKRYLIAEAEGVSSGQPEQKLYKAIGQIVVAASAVPPKGWWRELILVVHGAGITGHLKRVAALERLGIAALSIAEDPLDDSWIIARQPASYQLLPRIPERD